MQALLELAPLVAFFVAYHFCGNYISTGVLMAGMAVLLAVDYLLHRRISPMHALSAVLVFGLGAATLLLHDKHFIQLKPTILFWVAGLAFLASFWIGKQTLTERLFSAALQGQVRVPESLWRRMNTPLGRVLCAARRGQSPGGEVRERANLGLLEDRADGGHVRIRHCPGALSR